MSKGDRERILDAVGSARRDLEDAIASVPEGRIDEPGVVVEWSARDLAGHVTTWEREAAQALRRYLSDGDLKALVTWTDVDGLNARESRRKRQLSLAHLRREFDESHLQLIALLSEFPEGELASEEVEKRIRVDTYDHYAEHTAHIRDWLGAQAVEPTEN